MSESSLKPLVFLHPLSPTLENLKEIMSENAEEEGIEIYDVESPEEGVQLIPVIGQSLIICSNPKACAMLLQPVRRFVKKLETKTILISTKAIPGKTLEKFMKIGLTECVVEPVNPKTLLYKVRLQLRSISTKEESSELALKESQSKTEAENDQNKTENKAIKNEINNEDEDLYARKEDKRELAQEDDDLYGVKKSNNDKSVNTLDYINKKDNSNEEDEGIIEKRSNDYSDGHYEGENHEDQNIDNLSKNKSKYKEEKINGHYQGAVKKTENEKQAPKEKEDRELDTDDIKESIKKIANAELAKDNEKSKELLDIESADTEKRRSQKKEDEVKKAARKSDYQEAALGGNYKGSVASSEKDGPKQNKDKEAPLDTDALEDINKEIEMAFEEETIDDLLNEEEAVIESSEDRQKNSTQESSSGNLEGVLSTSEELPLENNKKKDSSLDLGNEKKETTSKEKEEEIKKNHHSNISDQIDGNMNGKTSTDISKDDTPKGEGSKADDIDGYLRGGASKKDEDKEKNKKEKKEVEKVEKDPHLPQQEQEPEETHDKEEKISLDLLEGEDKQKKEATVDLDDDNEDNKTSQLDFEDNVAPPLQNEDIKNNDKKKRSDAKSDEFDNNWGGNTSTDSTKNKNNKSNAKSDVISTHYSNKSSTTHNENDWGKDWKASQKEEEKEREKRSKVTPLAEITPDGETIDYAKLKEQFDSFEYGSEEKSKAPYTFESDIALVEVTEKTVLDTDGQLVTMQFEEIGEHIDDPINEYDQTFIYEPNPRGIQHVIRLLNLYQNQECAVDSIYEEVAAEASLHYQCDVIFYQKDRVSNKHLCRHNGFISNRLKEPVESSFDNVNEYNEILLNYQENLTIYQQDWNEIESEHYEYWSLCKSPIWSDPTFQNEENIFVFPYFEGQTHMGFAIIKPEAIVNEDQTSPLEILLESARGLYLNELFNKEKTVPTTTAITNKSDKKTSVGLLGSLFKKIAG